jgi:hypothetical protein
LLEPLLIQLNHGSSKSIKSWYLNLFDEFLGKQEACCSNIEECFFYLFRAQTIKNLFDEVWVSLPQLLQLELCSPNMLVYSFSKVDESEYAMAFISNDLPEWCGPQNIDQSHIKPDLIDLDCFILVQCVQGGEQVSE